jgi:hypothetical protein
MTDQTSASEKPTLPGAGEMPEPRTGRFYDLGDAPVECVTVSDAKDYGRQCFAAGEAKAGAELAMCKEVITNANNSLHGSQGFFLGMSGGFDPHHLSTPIENIKKQFREEFVANEALRAKVAGLVSALNTARIYASDSLNSHEFKQRFRGENCSVVIGCIREELAEIDSALRAALGEE